MRNNVKADGYDMSLGERREYAIRLTDEFLLELLDKQYPMLLEKTAVKTVARDDARGVTRIILTAPGAPKLNPGDEVPDGIYRNGCWFI